MKSVFQIAGAVLLLLLTFGCVWGFLASFEVGLSMFHLVYGLPGIICLAAALKILFGKRAGRKDWFWLICALVLFLTLVLLLWMVARGF